MRVGESGGRKYLDKKGGESTPISLVLAQKVGFFLFTAIYLFTRPFCLMAPNYHFFQNTDVCFFYSAVFFLSKWAEGPKVSLETVLSFAYNGRNFVKFFYGYVWRQYDCLSQFLYVMTLFPFEPDRAAEISMADVRKFPKNFIFYKKNLFINLQTSW